MGEGQVLEVGHGHVAPFGSVSLVQARSASTACGPLQTPTLIAPPRQLPPCVAPDEPRQTCDLLRRRLLLGAPRPSPCNTCSVQALLTDEITDVVLAASRALVAVAARSLA